MLVNWIILHRIRQSNYFLRNFPLTLICVDNMLCTFIYEVYGLKDRCFRFFFQIQVLYCINIPFSFSCRNVFFLLHVLQRFINK